MGQNESNFTLLFLPKCWKLPFPYPLPGCSMPEQWSSQESPRASLLSFPQSRSDIKSKLPDQKSWRPREGCLHEFSRLWRQVALWFLQVWLFLLLEQKIQNSALDSKAEINKADYQMTWFQATWTLHTGQGVLVQQRHLGTGAKAQLVIELLVLDHLLQTVTYISHLSGNSDPLRIRFKLSS